MYENISTSALYDGFPTSTIVDILMYGLDASNVLAVGTALEALASRDQHDVIYDVLTDYIYDLDEAITQVTASALVRVREESPVLGFMGQAIAHAILDRNAGRRARNHFDPEADFVLPIDIISRLAEDATPVEAEEMLPDIIADMAEHDCLNDNFDEDSLQIAFALIREGATNYKFYFDEEGDDEELPEYYD